MPFFGVLIGQLLIGVAFLALAMLFMPRVKQEGQEGTVMENPTASAGRTVGRVIGTVTIKSPNILFYGEKVMGRREIKASGK